jgi:hypothetical protein
MIDGLFRNCGLPNHWQKVCKTLLNSAATDDARVTAALSALKADCKLPSGLNDLCKNRDMFSNETFEELAYLPKTTDFGRDVLMRLRFGRSTLSEAIEDSLAVMLASVCRKAEGENRIQASLIRGRLAWLEMEISRTDVVEKLCQNGKIQISPLEPFDLDADLSECHYAQKKQHH